MTSPNGSWGISAQWNDISFVENLSHALSVTYVQGTNNKHHKINPDKGYLTTKDSLVEIDFNTTRTWPPCSNLATSSKISTARMRPIMGSMASLLATRPSSPTPGALL